MGRAVTGSPLDRLLLPLAVADPLTAAWARRSDRACISAHFCPLIHRPADRFSIALNVVRPLRGPPLQLCASHKAEVDTPYYTDRAAKDHSLIDRYPYKADQADRWPKLVSILHHRPQVLLAVGLDKVPCTLRAQCALLRRIDIAHEGQKHERVDNSADCLIEQKLDHDIFRALLVLGWLDSLDIWVVGCRGDICREEVLEEALPEDIRWVANDAENGELEDLVDVERKGCLCRCASASRALKSKQQCRARYPCTLTVPARGRWTQC